MEDFEAGAFLGALITALVILAIILLFLPEQNYIMCNQLSENGYGDTVFIDSTETCHLELEDGSTVPFMLVEKK